MRFAPLASLGLLLALSACATSPEKPVSAAVAPGSLPAAAAQVPQAADADADAEQDERLSRDAAGSLRTLIESVADEPASEPTAAVPNAKPEPAKKPLAGIDVELNESVRKWIRYFTVKDRARFKRMLERGEEYRDVVQSILAENGLPPELFYLAMIESGYVSHAKSRAKALGVWQFMRATGRHYGLESDFYVEERRDPIRSTEAASRYLRDLYRAFQSWHLAMAAYNSGEYRVLSAVMRGKTRDYWQLVKKGVLPRETREYVPKFLAAVIIGRDPAKFGFDLAATDPDFFPSVKAVEVPSPIALADVARLTGVPLAELRSANPHLLRGVTPPGAPMYEIWVPETKVGEVTAALPQLASARRGGLRVARAYASLHSGDSGHSGPSVEPAGRRAVRVARGDTLGAIAREHHVSVAYLRRLNGLSSNRIQVGQRLLLSAKSYHAPEKRYSRKPAARGAKKLKNASKTTRKKPSGRVTAGGERSPSSRGAGRSARSGVSSG